MNTERQEYQKKYQKEYYQKNKKKISDRFKHYYQEHAEEIRQRTAQYSASHPEKRKQWWNTHYEKNSEYYIEKTRARRRGYQPLSRTLIKKLYKTYPMCLACGNTEKLSIDHIVPISKGGKNDYENLQVLCISCNVKKGTNTMDYRRRS